MTKGLAKTAQHIARTEGVLHFKTEHLARKSCCYFFDYTGSAELLAPGLHVRSMGEVPPNDGDYLGGRPTRAAQVSRHLPQESICESRGSKQRLL